ncbi:hypothetical protein JTF08_13780 [Micrococcaceae bacterium RIT802]|nr:hypothetical protein [Micrococcaceae bacterium RIT 802]
MHEISWGAFGAVQASATTGDINWGAVGAVLLSLATITSSVFASRITAKGGKDTAEVSVKPGLEENTTARIELLFKEYERDRAEDERKRKELEAKVERQGREIEELKKKLPRYRSYIRRLRHIIESLGGDPGPWPEDLE